MNREQLLGHYDRLTSLIQKLPGGLQKPILRELVPIRELFLEQRAARLLLLGNPGPGCEEFLRTLVGSRPHGTPPPLPSTEQTGGTELQRPDIEPCGNDNGWRLFRTGKRGAVDVLDARGEGIDADFLKHAIARFRPDAIVVFHDSSAPGKEGNFEEVVSRIFLASGGSEPGDSGKKEGAENSHLAIPIVGISLSGSSGVERLRALLHARRDLAGRNIRVLPAGDTEETGKAICAFLPNAAKLEFAWLCNLRTAQAEIARSLLKSFTAVCGVIGMQPIPLADLPVLASLQSLMSGLIAYTSGRHLGPRAVAEFFGAVGVSVGVGMLFREGARAIVKIVPIWGNAVSGLVAGAGTYAIGRAAIAYFIEDTPVHEARKLFKTLMPKKGSFKKKHTPSLPE